jgi:two-component system chemotaxis response regulator CheY
MDTITHPPRGELIVGKRFLVVDDFSTMRRIVSGLLRSLGAELITEAEDGEQALKRLSDHSIDFVISDWNMPGMSGLELLHKLRSNPETSGIPFLLVTAEARKENIVEAARAGADGYIVKPFTPLVLGDKISTILLRRSES